MSCDAIFDEAGKWS
jgi:hypothetical protein